MAKARKIIEAEDPKAFLQRHSKWVVKPLTGTKYMVALYYQNQEVHNISINAHMPSDGSGDPEVQRQVRELAALGLMKYNNDPKFCVELQLYLNWLQHHMPCPDLEVWVTDKWLRDADAAGMPEKYTAETGKAAYKRDGKTGVMRVKLTGFVEEAEDPKSVFRQLPRGADNARCYIVFQEINGVEADVRAKCYFIDEIMNVGDVAMPGILVSAMTIAKALGEYEPGPGDWWETHKDLGNSIAERLHTQINTGNSWGNLNMEDYEMGLRWAFVAPPEVEDYMRQTRHWSRDEAEMLLGKYSDGDCEIIKKYDGIPSDWSDVNTLGEGEDPKAFLQQTAPRPGFLIFWTRDYMEDPHGKMLFLEEDTGSWVEKIKDATVYRLANWLTDQGEWRVDDFPAETMGILLTNSMGDPADDPDGPFYNVEQLHRIDTQYYLQADPKPERYADDDAWEQIGPQAFESEDPKRFLQQHGRDFTYSWDGTVHYATPLTPQAREFLDNVLLPVTHLDSDGTVVVQHQYWQQLLALLGDAGFTGRRVDEAEDPKSVLQAAKAESDKPEAVLARLGFEKRIGKSGEPIWWKQGQRVAFSISPFSRKKYWWTSWRRDGEGWKPMSTVEYKKWQDVVNRLSYELSFMTEGEDPKAVFRELPRIGWYSIRDEMNAEQRQWQEWFRSKVDQNFWMKVIAVKHQAVVNNRVQPRKTHYLAHIFHNSQPTSLIDKWFEEPEDMAGACVEAMAWGDSVLPELRLKLKESEDPKTVFHQMRKGLFKFKYEWTGDTGGWHPGVMYGLTNDRRAVLKKLREWYPRSQFYVSEPIPATEVEWAWYRNGDLRILGEAEDPKEFLKRVAPSQFLLTFNWVNGEEVNFSVPVYIEAIGWQMGTSYELSVPDFSRMVPAEYRDLVDWSAVSSEISIYLNDESAFYGYKGGELGQHETRIGDEGEDDAVNVAWTLNAPDDVKAWIIHRNDGTVTDEENQAIFQRYGLNESMADDIAKEANKAEEPKSPEQAEAGTYKKGHIRLQGFAIAIENAKDSVRKSKDPKNPWEVTMPAHYGYIKNTVGKDKDHLDVYIGENPSSMLAFVVNQVKKEGGAFDEHKIMLGFKSKDEATATYDKAFNGDLGPKLRKSVISCTIDQLKDWIVNGDPKKEFAILEEAEDPKHFLQHVAPRLRLNPTSPEIKQALNDCIDEMRGAGYADTDEEVKVFTDALELYVLGPSPPPEVRDTMLARMRALIPQLERNEFVIQAADLKRTLEVFEWRYGLRTRHDPAPAQESEDPKAFLQQVLPKRWNFKVEPAQADNGTPGFKLILTFEDQVVDDDLWMADEESVFNAGRDSMEELRRLETVMPFKPHKRLSLPDSYRQWHETAEDRYVMQAESKPDIKAEAEALLDAEDPKDFLRRVAPHPKLPERIVRIYVLMRDENAFERRIPVVWEKARVMKGDGWYAGINLHDRAPSLPYLGDDEWQDLLSTVEYHIMDGPPDPDGELDFVELHGDDYDGRIARVEWKYIGNYEADQEKATEYFGGVVGFRDINEGEDPKNALRLATADKVARQKSMLHLFKDTVYVRSVPKGDPPVMLRGIDKFCLSDAEPEPHVFTVLDLEQEMAWHRNAWRLEDGGVHGERLFKSEPNAIGAQIDWDKLVNQIK